MDERWPTPTTTLRTPQSADDVVPGSRLNRPFKLLFCSPAFLPAESHGGVPYSAFSLCKAMIRAGADVSVITTDRNGDRRLAVATDQWTDYDGVRVWYAKTADGPFLFAPSTRAAMAESIPNADCVINSSTLWMHSGWLAWRAAKRQGKPSLNYPRGLLDMWAYRHKALRKQLYWHTIGKRILRDATAVVALTEQERRRLRELHVTTRIEVIPNGAESATPETTPSRAWLDATYPALAGRRYVLFLGRIHQKKGMDLLLAAVRTLRTRTGQVAFVIAGPVDSAYHSQWQELIRINGLVDTLVLPGPVSGSTKAAWLGHADVFVLPSYSEGMPVAVLEALSAGCPVVITEACAVPEVAQTNAGIVINANVDELVSALSDLLENEARRKEMGLRARALAKATFDWDLIAARTLALCHEVTKLACG
jgi:glycosyltransferase involved in cell wall biosynthesis